MDKRAIIDKVKEEIINAKESDDYSDINESLCSKRLEWLEKNLGSVDEPSLVRKAYTLLLIKKMEIEPSEVPIVYETGTRITWRSYNWCPVLEACKELGLDTREVCRRGWEDSVSKFVSKIDSRLRFIRNYQKIRPYEAYCEESIELR
ncbi:hypothetical protein KY330_04170 [Candidatus Woesearchaeota archaeon]|nr:hypothetical protein [Candidatus Woesearchaeota archaeon]